MLLSNKLLTLKTKKKLIPSSLSAPVSLSSLPPKPIAIILFLSPPPPMVPFPSPPPFFFSFLFFYQSLFLSDFVRLWVPMVASSSSTSSYSSSSSNSTSNSSHCRRRHRSPKVKDREALKI